MADFPHYYSPKQVEEIFIERTELVFQEAQKRKQLPSSAKSTSRPRVVALGIDPQIGFCHPQASLFVPGAVEDTRRTIEWMYQNIEAIDQVAFSMDTHSLFQIFHPVWWKDAKGNYPQPFTTISLKDVRQGIWIPQQQVQESIEYLEKLEKLEKYQLTIWPFHTLQGGASQILVPALMEAALLQSFLTEKEIRFERKGQHPLTENYSVFSPEITEIQGKKVGKFNLDFVDFLQGFDRIYVFGQAKSHCVLASLLDLKQQMEKEDPHSLRKIWVLEDTMSPVPPPPVQPLPRELNFPQIANDAFQELAKAGINIVKTTDPLF